MLKFLRFLLIAVVLVVIAAGAAAAYLLQDPNRFKPEIEALIEAQSGVPLTIGGALGWRLWPPVSITAEDLRADYEGQAWQIGRLTLDLDAFAAMRDLEHWRVESLTVDDVTMHQEGSVLTVKQARLRELMPNRPAPVHAELTYAAEGQEPLPVILDGEVSVDPATLDLSLANTRIETTDAEGTCTLDLAPVANPAPGPAATEEDLIPVDLLRGFSWNGECQLDWVRIDDRRFENVAVNLDNEAGNSAILARIPQFFGGEAVADIAIDARRTPVRWTVTPTLTEVDSKELMEWLDQRLNWIADLAYGGTLTFEGNTADELIASMSGETRFDGGTGRIDIARIRSQLLALARMFNEGERIEGWPEMWDYQRFVGNWRIDRQHHQLNAALDNLSLQGEGDYRPAADEMDMLLTLEFGKDPSLPVFDLNPLLYDLPIPVRCRGSLADPSCRVDQKVAQQIVLQALGSEDSELRSKLERKIDEDVPEEYRDAARSLLDALGGSRKGKARDD
jgi:hypothetical protein